MNETPAAVEIRLSQDEVSDILWAIYTACPWTLESHRPLIDKLEKARGESL